MRPFIASFLLLLSIWAIGANDATRILELSADGTPSEIRSLFMFSDGVNVRGTWYVDPIDSTVSGATPLMIAALEQNDPEAVRVLIEVGGNVNGRSDELTTPLMFSAMNENPRIVTILLDAGAEIAAVDDYGWTSLFIAAGYNTNPEILSRLLEAGAEVDARDDYGWTPLMSAAWYNENPEVITALLEAGAEIDARDEDGWTPLMYAARYNENPAVITALLEAGAEVDARSDYSWTPLMYAARFSENPEVITALLEAGAEIDARSADGLTPLMLAGLNSIVNIATVLLKAGAEVDARSADGLTPLMYAARENENPNIIMELLAFGADGQIIDPEGKNAFAYAENNDQIKGTAAYWALNDARFNDRQ